MTDHCPDSLSGDESAPDFETSWARISLDFGPRGYELAEEIAAESEALQGDPAERIRREIQQMIEAVRGSQPVLPAEDEVQKLDEVELTAEIFEQLCEGQTPEDVAALADADSSSTADPSEEPIVEEQAEVEAGSENHGSTEPVDDEYERAEAEMERRITEATAEDVVRELLLAAVDLPQLLVYEADETTVDVYVLCIIDGDDLLTAEVDEKGNLSRGIAFESFAADLMELLPTRGGICADQESYAVSAPVTEIGEELTISADSTCAALIQIGMSELAIQVAHAALLNPIEVAPAAKGWVLVTSDPVSLVSLLSQVQRPSLIVASTENSHQLSFIMPAGFEPQFEEGTVGEWMQKVVGTPSDDVAGVVIDLTWGAPKTLTRHVPQRSTALDLLWTLPGMLPDPLNYVRINDEIENLTWMYNLDSTEAKRLRNYIEDTGSDTGMESVLQLLGHTIEVARVADERADITTMPGYRSFEPNVSTLKALTEAVAAQSAGSSVGGELAKNPWIVGIDGAAQLGASGVLAIMAVRRRSRGDSAKKAALASAALASVGITELLVARTFNKLQKLQEKNPTFEPLESQLAKYLEASTEPSKPGARVREILDSTELGAKAHTVGSKAKKKTKSQAKKYLRKFFR